MSLVFHELMPVCVLCLADIGACSGFPTYATVGHLVWVNKNSMENEGFVGGFMQPRGVLRTDWKPLYQAALLEADWIQLPRRIVAAEIAIRSRMDELDSNPDNAYGERDTLANARTMLSCLRRLAEEKKAS